MLNYHVHITYLFLNGSIVIMQNTQEIAELLKMKANATKIKKQRFVRMEINFVLGKNGGHRPSSLGSRSIVVVSE